MAKSEVDSEIRARVETFVDDLTELIGAAAVEAVHEAITGMGPSTSSRPGKRAAKPAKSRGTKAKKGKRIRRSSEEVERIGGLILADVKRDPGRRLGEIARSLGMETKDVRRPAFMLVEDGKLTTTGQRGGTRYFPKGAKGAAKTAKKKSRTTKKKGGRRKTGKRKKVA